MPSQAKEPLKSDKFPSRAFEEECGSDLFEYGGSHYLVYVDRYSGWPDMHVWQNAPSAEKVIKQLQKWFVNMCADQVRSDGGPQFDSADYREFLRAWGVIPGYSSPRFVQSNGLAESDVKAMKALVAKTGDIFGEEFQCGLLEWRNQGS